MKQPIKIHKVPKIVKQRIRKSYYKTLGTGSPLSLLTLGNNTDTVSFITHGNMQKYILLSSRDFAVSTSGRNTVDVVFVKIVLTKIF